jgi:hypothetical protein
MDQVLTMAQIEAQFDSEWVLIENPQTDEGGISSRHRTPPQTLRHRVHRQDA